MKDITNGEAHFKTSINEELYSVITEHGFELSTYRNDICPSFSKYDENGDTVLSLWIQYDDLECREYESMEKYALSLYEGGDYMEDVCCSDDYMEIIKALKKYCQ